jgi:ubiquinone/menaquinone biosynthesis C-methylase UbiE
MLLDAINLHEFYTSHLGLTTKRAIGKHIREVWPEVKNMNVLGIGYCPPYLNAFRSKAKGVISVMPVSQGILQQSNKVASQSSLTSEAELPLPDLSMDRVRIIHALEYVESVRPMMRKVWRVLSRNGRIIVVTPNRRGIWVAARAYALWLWPALFS